MPVGGTSLLLTKLTMPPPRVHILPRERLLALVPTAPGTRLVLVSAPAGFGKTTFLSTWCHALATQHGAAVAWVALDAGDNDPARFLAYMTAAVAQAMALPDGEGDDLAAAGTSTIDSERVLTRLLNALAALDHDLVLVLDDYHLITTPAVHVAVAFLLDHLPDRVRVAIGSRADPPLPLARLRAREQLIELRAADLRFTPDEVQAFVQTASNLALTPEEAHAVSAYVEGWPAGVQLVALALRSESRGNAAESGGALTTPLLARLAGSQQHIFAYLADDVFERQPPHLKAFLLQTAILERMCAPLCDAVLGIEPEALSIEKNGVGRGNTQCSMLNAQFADSYSRLLLEELERANLFVVPLDSERHWYRYHQLFHAFLGARLEREPPHAIAELHRRASAWYEQNQLLAGAVEHALAAGEAERAADLIEELAIAVVERGEYATLHRWLEQIPEAILAARPALCLWAAWAALLAGEVERIELPLRRAECAWRSANDQRKLGEVAHLQAHLARLRLDAVQTVAAAQQALANLAGEELTLRAGSVLALGAGQLLAGDLDAASATLADAYTQCQDHNFLGMLVALRCLGDLATRRGQLHVAAEKYQEVIALVGARALWERWEAAIPLGDLARERNDLDRALEVLRPALTAAEQAGVAVFLPAGYIALARTLQARGDGAAAASALERGLQGARQLGSLAYVHQIRAEQARLALAQGDLGSAQRWQIEVAPGLESDLGAAREAEALILARVLIARGRSDPSGPALHTAQTILERLRQDAEAHRRSGSLIEILVLTTLADSVAGRRDQALRVLQQALILAMPEGYARVFLDEGAPMHTLLAECRLQLAHDGRSLASEDVCRLRTYIDGLLAAVLQNGSRAAPQAANSHPPDPLVEPLSDRELEVLRLIAGGASNQAIATALVISIGTVKSHINHILGKLAACNRTAAVARARELGLLAI